MEYHAVLRWYGITLSAKDEELADSFFSGAAHSFARWLEADGVGPAQFHHERFLAHLRHLMLLVYRTGDFASARDESLRGLEKRERWNPDDISNDIPDPKMFEGLLSDPRYPVGIPHELDRHLKNLRPPAFHLRLAGNLGVRLRVVGTG